MRRVVVFPHPEGPSNMKNSPSATVNDDDWTAVNSPNFFQVPDDDFSHVSLENG
jgi:hypothetical protein